MFLELWDNLTKIITGKDEARFMAGGRFTDEGRDVALSVLKPLVLTYPNAVTGTKADGTPEIVLPPNADTWTLDGLVCANFTAERLFKLTEQERFDLVNLSDHTGAKIVEWAAENVPDFRRCQSWWDGTKCW